jgi:hypothetical protein
MDLSLLSSERMLHKDYDCKGTVANKASARTEHRTPLPRIPPVLNDVLSGLLSRDSLGIADAEACVASHGNVFNGRCLAVDNYSEPSIPSFSHHVKVYNDSTVTIHQFLNRV